MAEREASGWKSAAKLFLQATGWTAEGTRPQADRYVLIAAPHTSNWDLIYMLAFAQVFDVEPRWMGKHTLFEGPFGGLMHKLGGIPVRRSEKGNLVAQLAQVIRESESICLAVPVEGTRSYAPYWKSGFYHIARAAQVPIVMSYLDYSRKVGGFGPSIMPTGDIRADMDQIRAFYAGKAGRFPNEVGDIRLKEEDAEAATGPERQDAPGLV